MNKYMVSSDSKQNDVLRRMNALLAALNKHVDEHENCCLKSVLKNSRTCPESTSPDTTTFSPNESLNTKGGRK